MPKERRESEEKRRERGEQDVDHGGRRDAGEKKIIGLRGNRKSRGEKGSRTMSAVWGQTQKLIALVHQGQKEKKRGKGGSGCPEIDKERNRQGKRQHDDLRARAKS